jgi:hypothetical protein
MHPAWLPPVFRATGRGRGLRDHLDQRRLVARLRRPSRLDALRRTNQLDSEPDVAFDAITRLASTLLDVPITLVSLVDDRRQFFKSAQGLGEPWAGR